MIAIIGYTLGTLIGVLWWVAVIKLTQHIFF